MHAAPPAGVRCTGGVAWRAVQSVMPALAAGVTVGWLLLSTGLASGTVAAPMSAAVVACVAAVCWWRTPAQAVHLRWDGQSWFADDHAGTLDVMIDLGPWMLARLRPDGAGASPWIAVAASEAGPAWSAFRAAAYAGAPRLPRTAGPAAPMARD